MRKMARSLHSYIRGNPAQFYDWLVDESQTVPVGPSIWICGDCHIGNLGPIAARDGEVQISVRDFDQTVIGNPAHDLLRFALSLTA